jgi:YgiT-type zinc finger domain-containing protein
MKCIKCGNNTYESTTSEAIELENGVLVIRNIPCYKCEFCDEIHFTGDVVQQLEKIIMQAKQRMEQISVVDFSKVLTAA